MATKKKGLLAAAGNAAASGGGGSGVIYPDDASVNTTAYTQVYHYNYDDSRIVSSTLYSSGYIFGVVPSSTTGSSYGTSMEIDYEDEYLYLASTGAIRALDISTSISGVAGALAYSDSTNISSVFDMAVHKHQSVLYACCYSPNKVIAIDISNPTSMSLVGSFDLTNAKRCVLDQENELLYVTTNLYSITVLDVSDPTNMTQVGYYSGSSNVRNPLSLALDTTNDVLYVPSSTGKIAAFDVSDLSNLTVLDSVIFSSGINYLRLAPQDDILYASYGTTFSSLDVSDTSNLSYISGFNVGAYVTDMQIDHAQDYAVIVAGQDNVKSIDISNPSSMSVATTYTNYSYIDNAKFVRLGY